MKDLRPSNIPDRDETIKYLEDLKEKLKETPFVALGDNYVEQLRATLNYSPRLKVRELKLLEVKCFNNNNTTHSNQNEQINITGKFVHRDIIMYRGEHREEIIIPAPEPTIEMLSYPEMEFNLFDISGKVVGGNFILEFFNPIPDYESVIFYKDQEIALEEQTEENTSVYVLEGMTVEIPIEVFKTKQVVIRIPKIEYTPEKPKPMPVEEIEYAKYIIFEPFHSNTVNTTFDIEASKLVYPVRDIPSNVSNNGYFYWQIEGGVEKYLKISLLRLDKYKEHSLGINMYLSDDGVTKSERFTETEYIRSQGLISENEVYLHKFSIGTKHLKLEHFFPEIPTYIQVTENTYFFVFIPSLLWRKENGKYISHGNVSVSGKLITGNAPIEALLNQQATPLKITLNDSYKSTAKRYKLGGNERYIDEDFVYASPSDVLEMPDIIVQPFMFNNVERWVDEWFYPLFKRILDLKDKIVFDKVVRNPKEVSTMSADIAGYTIDNSNWQEERENIINHLKGLFIKGVQTKEEELRLYPFDERWWYEEDYDTLARHFISISYTIEGTDLLWDYPSTRTITIFSNPIFLAPIKAKYLLGGSSEFTDRTNVLLTQGENND